MEESSGSNSIGFEKPDDKITLTVMGMDGKSLCFSMKRDQTFLKLKTAYCEIRKLGDHKETAFLCNGRRLCCTNTPNDFELQNGDVIYAMLHQRGC